MGLTAMMTMLHVPRISTCKSPKGVPDLASSVGICPHFPGIGGKTGVKQHFAKLIKNLFRTGGVCVRKHGVSMP